MRKENYFIKIFCQALLIVLLLGQFSFAQQGSNKSIWLNTHKFQYNRVAFDVRAAYNVLVSKSFFDVNDPGHTFMGDPSGQTIFNSVGVTDGIYFDDTVPGFVSAVMRYLNNAGNYLVNFGDLDGEAVFRNLTARKITMTGLSPNPRLDSTSSGGNLVYDIAEGMDVERGEACDVVVISTDKDMTLTLSTVKFDAKVAGVVSEDPKILMGKDKSHKPLALAGIVRCKVNIENGPVKRGDILVTSSQSGYAMRADPDQVLPGMVIGSAIDNLENGQGKIYILVNQ